MDMCLYLDEAEWDRQCEEQHARIMNDPELREQYLAWCEWMTSREEEE